MSLTSHFRQFEASTPPLCIAETLDCSRGIVDLWYYFYELIDDVELLAAQEALMPSEERERHHSLHFDRDRRLFLATRTLVRTVLSNYARVEPSEWRFEAGRHGKPRIVRPTVTPPLFFNLANTYGLVVCAVSVAYERIGVDVERVDCKAEILEIANRYFSASEVGALRELSGSEQVRRFFAYWTLKESYIKARGIGLALPLDQFSFVVDNDPIGVTFDNESPDDATRWRFALLDAPPQHVIAIGADTGGAALSLRSSQFLPLRGNGAQI
jgi:4'-phosphopantetheinyl transferase